MFVFTKSEEFFVYIDIPIPIATFIRKQIINDLYRTIKNYWFILEEKLDLAHIPYNMRKEYINQEFEHVYITFTRNPYQKLISTFMNTKFSDEMTIKEFIMNVLSNEKFDDYDYKMIHYYPQYKFVTDEDGIIAKEIKIFKLEEYKNEFIKFSDKLVLKSYDLREYFDAESLVKFNEIYAKDFEAFGYEKVVDLSQYEPIDDIVVKPVDNILLRHDEIPEVPPIPEEQPNHSPVSDSKLNPLKQFMNR